MFHVCRFAAVIAGLALSARAQTESVLYSFTGGTDGRYPVAGVVIDPAGNLYGTTATGGDRNTCGPAGCGVVYQLSPKPNWNLNILHAFTGGADGAEPLAGLILDQGHLYGTTSYGGNDNDCKVFGPGCGEVFKFSLQNGIWKQTTVFDFNGPGDGWYPTAPVIRDAAGNFYGTNYYGGSNVFCNGSNDGCGVVYKLSPKPGGGWTASVLHVFAAGTVGFGGYLPNSGVVLDAAGNLYGTTLEGGNMDDCQGYGCGVVYQLSPTPRGPWSETILHRFTLGTDGGIPWAGVILDSQGNLFGAAEQGGNLNACGGKGCGTIFELSPGNGQWTFKVIHAFNGADGFSPVATLVFDSNGSLYGTTQSGGDLTCNAPFGCGTVFRLSPVQGGWKHSVVYAFKPPPDGFYPVSSVAFDASGNIFGTTEYGGLGYGTVFEIKP